MAGEQQIIPSIEERGMQVRDIGYVTTYDNSLVPGRLSANSLELVHVFDKMRAVKAFIFDVDGVLTNNELHITEQGELLRTMNVRDGQAIKWALDAGMTVAIITGGKSEGVKKRLTELGIHEYYSGVKHKLEVFQSILERNQLLASEICYVGDDLPDLPVLRKVVLSVCPADAVPEVMDICDFISPLKGGMGCVREIIEKVLKLQEKWPEY
jgi:3-deoxy-D-manno-octulosonate 8-phosphate phosphatase (KDO 8-P phosphatase)